MSGRDLARPCFEAAFTIRSGRPEDLAAIVLLERCGEGAPHWGEVVYRTILGGDVVGQGVIRRTLVAEDRGALAGFAVASVRGDPAHEGVELESILVDEERRRRGIGRALCAAVVAWARELGAAAVDLEVRSSSGARALYRGLGFVEVGERRDYYREPQEDAVLMRLELA